MATTDTGNIVRQSDQGVPTFSRPTGQSLFDTLKDYSGLADDVSGAVGNVINTVKGKPSSQPKAPGPVTEQPKEGDWMKYAMIAGGVLVVIVAAKFLLKK